MSLSNQLYGLIVCGGSSTRMGVDKSLLVYADKPQRYHIYRMIEPICTKVFISCNAEQMNTMDENYPCIIDLPAYSGIGPMAALLSAFDQCPGTDFLVIGCDYPFLKQTNINEFISNLDKKYIAASFYNDTGKLYEPMLAWYSYRSAEKLKSLFDQKEYSLQHFLKISNAGKIRPSSEKIIKSVDTMEGYYAAVNELNKNENASI